jgi:hypothetical protein
MAGRDNLSHFARRKESSRPRYRLCGRRVVQQRQISTGKGSC